MSAISKPAMDIIIASIPAEIMMPRVMLWQDHGLILAAADGDLAPTVEGLRMHGSTVEICSTLLGPCHVLLQSDQILRWRGILVIFPLRYLSLGKRVNATLSWAPLPV